jgi:hypothetical protein
MGFFSFFGKSREHSALIDSGEIEPNVREEFDEKKDAEDFVLRMMTVATFAGGAYKSYPRVYKSKDGKWVGAIFQIPK